MKRIFLGALSLSACFLASCSDSSSSGASDPNDNYKPSGKIDVELSQCEAIDDAELSAQIETAVANLSQFVAVAASDHRDLSTMQAESQSAKVLFRSALEKYPSSCDAQLGLALAQIADLVNNEDVAEVYGTLVNGTSAQKLALFNIDNAGALGNVLTKTVDGELITDRVQKVAANSALPAVDSAIAIIGNILNYDYRFAYSSEDFDVSIGRGELLLAEGTVRSLKAALTVIASYDLDASKDGSYNWAFPQAGKWQSHVIGNASSDVKESVDHVRDLLSSKSTFLSVKSSWKSAYKGVPQILDSAATNIRDGLEYLLEASTNGSANSTLSMLVGDDEDADLSVASIEDAIQIVDSIRQAMSSTVEVEIQGVPVKVNVAKFFENTDGFQKYLPYVELMSVDHWQDSYLNADEKYVSWGTLRKIYDDTEEEALIVFALTQMVTFAQEKISSDISDISVSWDLDEVDGSGLMDAIYLFYDDEEDDYERAELEWNGCSYQIVREEGDALTDELSNSFCKVENGEVLFKVASTKLKPDYLHFNDKSGKVKVTFTEFAWNYADLEDEARDAYLESVLEFPDLTFGGVFPEMDKSTLLGLIFDYFN